MPKITNILNFSNFLRTFHFNQKTFSFWTKACQDIQLSSLVDWSAWWDWWIGIKTKFLGKVYHALLFSLDYLFFPLIYKIFKWLSENIKYAKKNIFKNHYLKIMRKEKNRSINIQYTNPFHYTYLQKYSEINNVICQKPKQNIQELAVYMNRN